MFKTWFNFSKKKETQMVPQIPDVVIPALPIAENKIIIKWAAKKSAHISQVYRRGLEFCFCSEKFEQATDFVLCKDFLQDALMALHCKKAITLYGFNYNPNEVLISIDPVRIIIGNTTDPEFSDKISNCISMLNQVESELRIKPTRALVIDNPCAPHKALWLIEGSSRWVLSPPMVSLYTLMIRAGFKHKANHSWRRTLSDLVEEAKKPAEAPNFNNLELPTTGKNDPSQIAMAMPGIERILKHGYAKIFYKDPVKNYPNIDVGTMHNNFGICGFASGTTANSMEYWHRDVNAPKAPKNSKKKTTKTKDVPPVEQVVVNPNPIINAAAIPFEAQQAPKVNVPVELPVNVPVNPIVDLNATDKEVFLAKPKIVRKSRKKEVKK